MLPNFLKTVPTCNFSPHQRQLHFLTRNDQSSKKVNKRHSNETIFTPLTKTIFALLVKLLHAKLIKRISFRQLDYPAKNFNPKAQYACNYDAVVHHTNRCWALKHKIQDLIYEVILQKKNTIQKLSPVMCHFDRCPNLSK